MDIIKRKKELENDIEHNLKNLFEKTKEVLNKEVHIPFFNLAKNNNKDFHIEIDLPGVKKEDIEVELKDNILTVRAERKMKKEINDEDYYIKESSFGHIESSFNIPKDINEDEISAEYEDGRLIIYLRNKDKDNEKVKSIDVK